MRVNDFWKHWTISENPFAAEEARNDQVFMRLDLLESTHPDFAKLYGAPERPTPAIVFGEKGSGKTALRLTLEHRYAEHNAQSDTGRTWIVGYDDLNQFLDTFTQRVRGRNPLKKIRISDHQDAILSRAVTALVDAILSSKSTKPGFRKGLRTVRRMPRHKRVSLSLLAALYDQPQSGSARDRFTRLKRAARIRTHHALQWFLAGAMATLSAIMAWWGSALDMPDWATTAIVWGALVVSAVFLTARVVDMACIFWISWRVHREIRAVRHSVPALAARLRHIGRRAFSELSLPLPGDHESRYEFTRRLLGVLEPFGYAGMVVLVDCVDEPAIVNGDVDMMQDLVWPMLNNKFLQQEQVGIKLLLPIELRYRVHRESEAFFLKARLDKQNMVDRLTWTGSALYDLANLRLQSCHQGDGDGVTLADLFDDSVTTQDLVDALDQMHQPRDAFKWLYRMIHEHCSNTPNDKPVWKIPRLTLVQTAKEQARRLVEMQRGFEPA